MLQSVIDGLNDSQYEAVMSNHKRLLVLAGAGSGKTRTLTAKIAKLLNEEKAKPAEVLALTFTRMAGKNMKDKIKELASINTKDLFANTFHAFALDFITEFPELFGLKEEFSLYDSDDKKDILKTIDKELKLKVKWKKPYEEMKKIERRAWDQLMNEYHYRMRSWNAISISDLLEEFIRAVSLDDDKRQALHDKYKYVFVDEFQDTNLEQLEIIKLLDPEYLMVIGDDAQSIYGWNGARVKNILEFEDNFQAHVIKLRENYRSTKQIVSAADKLINHSQENIEKDSVAFTVGGPVNVFETQFQNDEFKNILNKVMVSSFDYKDTAVLCRSNKLASAVADFLSLNDIPVNLISNATDVINQSHIKDMIKIMSVVLNRNNEWQILKTANAFGNFLSSADQSRLELEKTMTGKSLFSTLESAGNKYALKINSLDAWKFSKPSELFKRIDIVFGVSAQMAEQGRETKLIQIDQATRWIKDWEVKMSWNNKNTSIGSFLRYLMLRDVQDKVSKDKDAVNVMTIHASKGLEYQQVFIPSASEKTFERGDIEEQRRLFYVAITRAISELCISWSETTSENFSFYKNSPTEFITEAGL